MNRMAPLNMTTGPVQVSQGVETAGHGALSSPHIGDFWTFHDSVIERLKRIVATKETLFMMPGSIRMGISVALANIVRPGWRALAITNGFWGTLIADYLRACGAEVIELASSDLAPVSPESVAKALADEHFDLVSIVHVETNAGVVNPIAEIGALVAQTDALFFVDTACSAGAQPVLSDAWKIDIGVTGSHKCLGGLPGLAIITLSQKALSRVGRGSGPLCALDLRTLLRDLLERPQRPLFTLPPAPVHALSAALDEIEAIGHDAWFTQHKAVADRFRQAMRGAGLNMLTDRVGTDDAMLSVAVQAVAYPDRFDDAAFRARLADRHGIHVIGNIGDWQGHSFRLGLMSGPQIAEATLDRVIAAIIAEATT